MGDLLRLETRTRPSFRDGMKSTFNRGGMSLCPTTRRQYQPSKKAQVKTHLLETVCKNASNQAAKCLFFMSLNLRERRCLLGCIFMRLVFHTCKKAQAKTKTFAISSFSTTAKHHNSPQNTAFLPNETQAQCLVE
jgi:hypothetical protein